MIAIWSRGAGRRLPPREKARVQAWSQPVRGDATDAKIVDVQRFRKHVWWVGGNATAYRPLLEAALVNDSPEMVDVLSEVVNKSISNVSAEHL